MRFAILDLETTGGSARMERITEIAIILYEEGEIIQEYQTLVNPERSVPPFIANMTGITDELLRDAPKFYEVAKDVVQITEGAILVAHNARFDYAFLQKEFASLGYTYSRKRLCTVQLSRRLLPELPRHGLDALVDHFGIELERRHRAMDDTRATLKLFQYLMEMDKGFNTPKELINFGIKTSQIPQDMDMATLQKLPEECGVYFFEDQDGRYLYIGKSINIKKRIFQHLREMNTKARELQRQTAHISYTLTGSELVSLLEESRLIKKYKPPLNKAQRNNRYPYGILPGMTDGYISFKIEKVREENEFQYLDRFSSKKSARGRLKKLVADFQLCRELCGLEKRKKSGDDVGCSDLLYGYCLGACVGNEERELYNERAKEAVDELDNRFDRDFLLIEPGRRLDEKAIILIQNGHYSGFTFLSEDDAFTAEDIRDQIPSQEPMREMNRIVKTYLSTHPRMKIEYLKSSSPNQTF